MDFEKFRKPVSKDIQVAGVTVHVKYAPSRAFTQLRKFVDQGACLVPCSAIKEADCKALAYGDYGHASISADVPNATAGESAAMFIDFMKAMALFTDEEFLTRIAEEAPKKKDGHLTASRVPFECHMDGAFRNGEFYAITAKTEKGDCISIGVARKRFNEYEGFGMGASASELLASGRFGGIAQRMGLQAAGSQESQESKPGRLSWAEMAQARGIDFSEFLQAKNSAAVHTPGEAIDVSMYRTVISKGITAAGVTAQVTYKPNGMFTQINKLVREGLRAILDTSEDKSVVCQVFDDEMANYGAGAADFFSRGYASSEQAREMAAGFMKVMALFTDDEALSRLVGDAPKGKGGHLEEGLVILNCCMAGAFENGACYRIVAETSEDDQIDIKVQRRLLDDGSDTLGGGITPNQLLSSPGYAGIAQRMGLSAEDDSFAAF